MSIYTVDNSGQWWKFDINPDGTDSRDRVSQPGYLPGAPTFSEVIRDAALEIGALDMGETLSLDEQTFCMQKLLDLIDRWNARRPMIFSVDFQLYTLTPNLNPHTIGPSGTWVVNLRPVRIVSAGLVLDGSPAVELPIAIRDDDWWANQRIKTLSSTLPTNLYPSYSWPNAALNFWPVPDTAYQVRLQTWSPLSTLLGLDTPFSLPPAYRDAMVYNLALRIAPAFRAAVSPVTVKEANESLKAVMGLNDSPSPRMATADSGMPAARRGGFNWLTGGIK